MLMPSMIKRSSDSECSSELNRELVVGRRGACGGLRAGIASEAGFDKLSQRTLRILSLTKGARSARKVSVSAGQVQTESGRRFGGRLRQSQPAHAAHPEPVEGCEISAQGVGQRADGCASNSSLAGKRTR